MNPLTDPDRRPPGHVPITCTRCGGFVAWCAPPTLRALRPILCAHADDDGAGAHWLRPGERCERATDR